MKTNIIKRTITILALTLGFAGGVVADNYTSPTLEKDNGQIDIYLNLHGTETSPLNITSVTEERITKDLKAVYGENNLKTPLKDNVYLRWYTYDTAKNEIVKIVNNSTPQWCFRFGSIDNSNINPYGTGSDCNTGPQDNIYRWYSGRNPWNSTDNLLEKVLNVYVIGQNDWSNSGSKFYYDSNYEIICEVANKTVDANTIDTYISSMEKEEKFFQLRYVIHFGKDPNGFEGALKESGGKEVDLSVKSENNEGAITSYSYDKTTKISTAGINLSKDANTLSGGATYARWYVADASGKELSATIESNKITTTTGVTVTLPGGITYHQPTTDATNSLYWFSSTAGTAAIDGVTISGKYGALTGCRLVCVMSNDTPSSDKFKLSNDGQTVIEEPDWDLKYVIDFNSLPFVQPKLKSNGKTVDVYLGVKDADISSNKINNLSTIASTAGYSKTAVQSAASALISSLDDSYARIYMLNKNEEIVPWQNSDFAGGTTFNTGSWYGKFGSNALGCGKKSQDSYSDNIYRYYKGKASQWDGTINTIPDAIFLSNGFDMAFGSDINPAKSGNTIVVEFASYTDKDKENNAIAGYKCANDNADDFYSLRYVIHFNEEFPADNIDNADTYKTAEASVIMNSNVYKKDAGPFYVESSNGALSKITIDLSKAENATNLGINTGVKYARWYFTDADGNTPSTLNGVELSFAGSTTGQEVIKNGNTDSSKGKYVYSNSEVSTAPLSIVLQNGSLSQLKDLRLVCVMSTDGSGALVDANSDSKVTHEPDWDVKYVLSFVEDNDGFQALNRFDDTSYTSASTMVALGKNTSAYSYEENEGSGKLTITLSNDENVKKAKLNGGVKYARWFVVDESDNIVTNSSLTFTSSTNGVELKKNDSYGYYYYMAAKGTAAMDGITVSGTKADLLKYRIACVLSAEAKNINLSSDEGATVLHEPDWDMYYVITSTSYVQFQHYIGYAYNTEANKDASYSATDNHNGGVAYVSDGTSPINEYAFTPAVWEEHNGHKYQKVHEWDYEIYVEPGKVVSLAIPIEKANEVLEPEGYIRWYDYDTDSKSDNLKQKATDLNESSLGLWIYDYPPANVSSYGVTDNMFKDLTFTAPSTNWKGSTIACDVSRYVDGAISDDGNSLREPTLSIRYKFIIKPAKVIADSVMNAIIKTQGASVLEDNGYITLGLSENEESKKIGGTEYNFKKGTANLRVNLHAVTDYYFYPYSSPFAKVSSTDNVASKFTTTEPVQAKSVKWYVFDSSGNYYMELTGMGRMQAINLKDLSGEYKSRTNENDTKKIILKPGDMAYVIAYLADAEYNATKFCPVARFNCRFHKDEYPIEEGSVPTYRTIKWLEANYKRAGNPITFDEDSKGTNLYAPTGPIDNKTYQPSLWNRRHYGYVYSGLYDKYDKSSIGNTGFYAGLACKHGEYGLFKTLNVANISGRDNTFNGKSYHYGGYNANELRDRTYAMTGQSGYFLYVDASDEARPICSAEFDADLCVGSTFVLSAAVANMTDNSSHTAPQLMFHLYGINKDAEGNIIDQKLIHSFATCDFNTVCSNTIGKWYQVYSKITLLSGTGIEYYKHFLVEVDNYGSDTNGNDFAIDDLRFYTRLAKVIPTQDKPLCSGKDKGYATMKILHESLVAQFGTVEQWYTKKIRFQVRKSSDNSVVTDIYGTGNKEYSEMTFYRYIKNEDKLLNEKQYAPKDQLQYYELINDELYFTFVPTGLKLLGTGEYYVSMQLQNKEGEDTEATTDSDFTAWGKPSDPCSVYSEYFMMYSQQPSIDTGSTSADNEIVVPCPKDDNTTTTVSNTLKSSMTVPDPIHGGSATVSGILYDWYIGTAADFKANVSTALNNFRGEYPYVTSLTGVSAKGNFTSDNLTTLTNLVTSKKLYLAADKIDYSFGTTEVNNKVFTIYLNPVTHYLKKDVANGTLTAVNEKPTDMTNIVELCANGSELQFNVVLGGPELNLGFHDVTYPSGTDRVLRLGLQQLNAFTATTDDKNKEHGVATLRIPVNSYASLGTDKTKFTLGIHEDNSDLVVYKTNDPTWGTLDKTVKVGTVTALKEKDSDGNPYIDVQYCVPDGKAFHEGYEYEVSFQIYDKEYDTNTNYENICWGDVYYTMKIVPEYATWTASATTGGNTNWNNDENWTRSDRATLYKNTGEDEGNTLAKNTDSYENNGEGNLSSLDKGTSQPKSYVPMKFTKVTICIPADEKKQSFPYLSNLDYTTLQSGLATENSLLNADSYKATENIQYDIMVKIEKELSDKMLYDCEKFYGNTCEQIYFKPDAQLRCQQFLIYDAAWVEKELLPNKWYTLTSPLKAVYAGDMYAPQSTGRQETEAFQPITFGDATGESNLYSRNKLPFYQRSWDKSESIMVTNDSGEEKRKADISYTDWTVSETENTTTNILTSNWSHLYNDMEEKYWYDYNAASGTDPGMTGFSVKVSPTSSVKLTDTDKVLLRLPKADTTYDYYKYDDKTKGNTVTLNKDDNGRLLLDKMLLDKNSTSGTIARCEIDLTSDAIKNATSVNKLILIGNPYMSSLDMTLFFAANTNLDKKVWTIVDNEIRRYNYASVSSTEVPPTIAPMQSFFVKLADGTTATKVFFTTNMTTNKQVDFPSATKTVSGSTASNVRTRTGYVEQPLPQLTLTATNAAGHSTAEVKLNAEADAGFVDSEDVEMLYDSNLADLPMLYTVAGTMAVSLNALPEVKMLPLGIVSSTTTDATLTITGSDSFSSTLYLYDSKTKKSTELTEPTTVTIAANAHGRYYLTTVLPEQIEETDQSGIHCYSPQPGVLVVSSPMDELQQVDVYGIDGTLIKRLAPAGVTSVTETLSRNIYIVKVRTANSSKTIKIRVN